MNDPKQDDAALIRLVAGANTEALSVLYDRYNRLVFSVALAILGEEAAAEEVTMDVFVRVWRGAGTYRPELGKVSTWLVAITRHHAIDVLRWQNSRPDANSLLLDETFQADNHSSPAPEEETERKSQRELVRKAVAQLPVDQRQALVLSFFRGYTHEQIAEKLNQPLGTIKTRIRLAMQKLRLLLQNQPADASDESSDTYPMYEKE